MAQMPVTGGAGVRQGMDKTVRRRQPRTVFFLSTAAVPLVFWLMRGDGPEVLAGITGLVLFGAAAMCLYLGTQRPRRWPAKSIGAVLMGLTVGVLTLYQGVPFGACVVLAVLATGMTVLGFGSDPLLAFRVRLRRTATARGYKIFLAAQRVLNHLPEQVAPLGETEVLSRTLAFREAILTGMARNPGLIEAATPALREVLTEVAEATEVFVGAYVDEPDHQLKATYMLLLADMAAAFDVTLDKLGEWPVATRQAAEDIDLLATAES
ncbi:MAG: hypothetical protein ACPG7W_01535 [Paracoccaceae bacterium]